MDQEIQGETEEAARHAGHEWLRRTRRPLGPMSRKQQAVRCPSAVTSSTRDETSPEKLVCRNDAIEWAAPDAEPADRSRSRGIRF